MKLVGFGLKINQVKFEVGKVWQSFMPKRKDILHRVSEDLISLSRYPKGYFEAFEPSKEFEKWAAVEVSEWKNVPDGLETLVIPAGKYAVFSYRGLSSDPSIFQEIFGAWLPQSGYVLDERPHFEVLGEKYRNKDPNSEEEIWIPIKG